MIRLAQQDPHHSVPPLLVLGRIAPCSGHPAHTLIEDGTLSLVVKPHMDLLFAAVPCAVGTHVIPRPRSPLPHLLPPLLNRKAAAE